MHAIQYYLATEKDIEPIIQFRQAMFYEITGHCRHEDEAIWVSNLRQYFTTSLNKIYFAWMAMQGEQLAGTGGFYINVRPGSPTNPSGRIAYIMGMYTRPEFRKQGICSEILLRIMEKGKELGITMFEMHATDAGAAIYLQHGFHKHSEPTYRKYIR